MGEPKVPSATLVTIMRGTDPKKLERLTLIQIDKDDGTLSDLRKSLGTSGYMKRSDRFLSWICFPIHKADESKYNWKEAIWPIQDNSSNAKKPDAHEANLESAGAGPQSAPAADDNNPDEVDNDKRTVPKASRERLNISNTTHPRIAILSTEGGGVDVPRGPGREQRIPKLPDPSTVDHGAVVPNGEGMNAVTLDCKQIAHMFKTNDIFCGSSIIDHPTSRVCARIFRPPPTLHSLIRVSDTSSIETHTTSSAHHSNLFKYGFGEAIGLLNTPWVRVSASYSHPNNTANVTDNSTYTTAIYRYSRAIIRLPVSSLRPTKEFQNDLVKALEGDTDEIKREQLGAFFATYGHVFATEIHLGGHLHMTEKSKKGDQNELVSYEGNVRASLASILGGSNKHSWKDDHDASCARSGACLGIEAALDKLESNQVDKVETSARLAPAV
ncbi:hypothetical protein FRC11_009320 [Ceratobasidium sp. 423]|nr:hypothetical protein FRC11_009320 [Ceratobasidium sp. 423]